MAKSTQKSLLTGQKAASKPASTKPTHISKATRTLLPAPQQNNALSKKSLAAIPNQRQKLLLSSVNGHYGSIGHGLGQLHYSVHVLFYLSQPLIAHQKECILNRY